jgi:hypothetical protein
MLWVLQEYERQALAGFERKQGELGLHTLGTMNSLGAVLTKLDKVEEAEVRGRKATMRKTSRKNNILAFSV